jgi:DNA-binding CsgD family transcriptional regulator
LQTAPVDVAHVAEQAIAQLQELLGPDPELLRLQDRDPSLSLVRGYLARTLRTGLAHPEHTAEIAVLLQDVDAALHADLDRRMRLYSQQSKGLTRAVRAVSGSDRRLPEVVTRELCAVLGYAKAMYSFVSGSSWAPTSVSVHSELSGDFGGLVAAVDGHSISLRDAPREAELVRRRRPYAIGRTDIYRHTYRPLLDLSRTDSYLAVPVVVGERAVAIVHVDLHGNDLSDTDFHIVGTVAEVCALATETAGLRAQIARQNRHTRSELDRLNRALRDLERFDVTLDDADDRRIDSEAIADRKPEDDYATPLSARERDVLALMATGATNAAISRQLCISDGTVKSHVQRIFKKLGVTTRAEAAALYAGRRAATGVAG